MALSNYASSPAANLTGAAKTSGSELPQHADQLNHLAHRLNEQNDRLASLLGRLFGPAPQEDQSGETEPSGGVLHVAQFAARRIGLETERLQVQLSRLENLV